MAFHLAIRKQRIPSNPSLVQLLSTSSSDPPSRNGNESGENPSQSSASSSSSSPSQLSFSSYFSDVKASLRQRTPQQQNERKSFVRSDFNTRNPAPFSFSGKQSGGTVSSLEEIRKNLSEFRRLSGAPAASNSGVTPSSRSQPQISLQELYKRNVLSNSGDSPSDSGPLKSGSLSFDAIRESLRQMRSKKEATNSTERQAPGRFSLSRFQNNLKIKPGEDLSSNVIGGTEALPSAVFGKEIEERKAKKRNDDETEEMKTEFLKTYSPEELGEKLRLLRPEGKKDEGWFTLQELNERLIKLREMEEKEATSPKFGVSYAELRASIQKLSFAEEERKKKTALQKLDILGQLGGTPAYMLHPPKEHLVDSYFHPDNMSSAEKMKIELAKVREEFKMSESDCGSARVQVALLTTKIKHLSSVLHKKDKHSRKGLQAMVQRRKKFLKYLRRTDWDSYCLVLSKLGLRDNPDYKN